MLFVLNTWLLGNPKNIKGIIQNSESKTENTIYSFLTLFSNSVIIEKEKGNVMLLERVVTAENAITFLKLTLLAKNTAKGNNA